MFSALAEARYPYCEALLALSKFKTVPLSFDHIEYFKSKNLPGLEMAYQLVPPRTENKETIVLLHGLGDYMEKMYPLARKFLDDGYGVLLVDLRGHGYTLKKTLEVMMEKNLSQFPESFQPEDNVKDITDLILDKGIKRFHIVGHSHGGGIAYALAHKFYLMKKDGKLKSPQSPRLLSIHMLAPYVSRIDKFWSDSAFTPEIMLQETSKQLVKAGADAQSIYSVFDPLFELFINANRTTQYFTDYFKIGWGGQKFIDTLTDPALEISLRKNFTQYFRNRLEKYVHRSLTEDEKKLVDIEAEVTLLVTKGNRSLDLLDRTHEIPPVNVDVQVIGARDDQVVPMAQLMDFNMRLKQAEIRNSLVFLEDPQADHFMNLDNTSEVYSLITREIRSLPKVK